MKNKKKIIILGSTGNIGTQTLDVVRMYPDKFDVVGLAAHSNVELFEQQVKEFSPTYKVLTNPEAAQKCSFEVETGEDALVALASKKDYDTLIVATVGLTGIRATLAAIKNKKNIALANKETLVAAGPLVLAEAKKYNVPIMPIDSEHSALFQCLNGEDPKNIHRLILTCSGGALRDHTKKDLENVTIADTLDHKTWGMGQKITIDSATLMNKGFEVIEASYLYDIPPEKIDVVIHRESIIHSMIEYSDGSIMAQLSNPDMKLPIQYALSYPERWDAPLTRFDFSQNLTFATPDLDRFPCIGYAYEALKIGGTMPAFMNAANDEAVAQFLSKKCTYSDIPYTIRTAMDLHTVIKDPTLKDIEKAIGDGTHSAQKILDKK